MRLTPHWTTTGGPAQRRSLRRPVWRQRTPGRLEGLIPCARGHCLDLRSRACCLRRLAPTACGGGAAPAPGAHWTPPRRCPHLCRGREEGTETFLGRSTRTNASRHAAPSRRERRKTCGGPPHRVCAVLRQSSQHTTPSADNARSPPAGKKNNTAHRSSLSLDKRGPHTGSARTAPGVCL